MIEKDPTNWTVATWMLAFSMATAGGLVNWYTRLKSGKTKVFNIVELIGEVFTAAFVGVGAFMLLDGIGQPAGVCAAASGIGGHMATRLLFAIERKVKSKLESA